jgi:2-haloacid dehalogenase
VNIQQYPDLKAKVDTAFEAAFDVNASDFLHLAQQLGC